MAVYTEVSFAEASALLQQLDLGTLESMQGCAGGIENTNYFVSTQHHGQVHDYVLTLFERLTFEQLPFYLQLMKHLAGRDFAPSQPNLRGLSWWNDTVPVVLPYLTDSQKTLITQELAYQNQVAAQPSYADLPRGPVHADLFCNNVMFETVAGQPALSGVFDFYFSGIDSWLFDLGVCLNDWCIDPTSGMQHAPNTRHFLAAYSAVRPFQPAEQELLPAMLRAAALRFWLSRLRDFYRPRQASMLQAHDPNHFERVLRH